MRGQSYIDSATIIRWIDQQTDQFRPADPAQGFYCEETMALAQGVCEKAMSAFYERTAPKNSNIKAGLIAVAGRSAMAWQPWSRYGDAAPYLFGDHLTHADLITYVAAQFVRKTNPHLNEAGAYPALEALEERLEARLEALNHLMASYSTKLSAKRL